MGKQLAAEPVVEATAVVASRVVVAVVVVVLRIFPNGHPSAQREQVLYTIYQAQFTASNSVLYN
jgi:hypothetical protein